MKIPKKLKVGGLTYKVTVTNNLLSGEDYNGEILYRQLKINLRASMDKTKQEQAFVHELMHAIFLFTGHIDHDEKLVEELAQGLYAVIKDNKGIFKEENL